MCETVFPMQIVSHRNFFVSVHWLRAHEFLIGFLNVPEFNSHTEVAGTEQLQLLFQFLRGEFKNNIISSA